MIPNTTKKPAVVPKWRTITTDNMKQLLGEIDFLSKDNIDQMSDCGKKQARDLDGKNWRLYLWEEHSRQASQGYRPAGVDDAEWSTEIERLVLKIGTIFIVFCKRQVVDGAESVADVIEAWIWRPGEGSWPVAEYRAVPPSRM